MDWIKKSVEKKIIVNISLVIVSLIIITVLAEIFVRVFTPKGAYSCSAYDDEVGLTIYPGSKVIYNKVRYTINYANKDGFLDIDHAYNQNEGKYRVAFFGDSYVEAMQVPIEQKFFRLLPEKISGKEMEYFGFGISGQGTLHSYLNYRKQSKKYNLDMVVYVFVENDLGDNISVISRNDIRPVARLSDISPSGFEIDTTYKKYNSPSIRMARSIYRHSLFANIIIQRVILLKQKGMMLRLAEEDKQMATVAKNNIPDQNDLPSSWPIPVKDYAEKLGFNMLRQWAKKVRDDGKDFIVFYVPRSEVDSKDTWKGWLLESCSKLNIQVIDPSDEFVKKVKEGIQIYDDHWTPEGHRVAAQVIERWLRGYLQEKR